MPISISEMLLYLVLPFLLIMAGAMPSAAVAVMFFILPILYLLYRRFGIYMPFSCVVCYGVLSLILNYDILTVIYFVTLMFMLAGLAAAVQFKYLPALAICVVTSVVGGFIGIGIVCGAEGESIGDIAARYVVAEYDDPVIGYLARDYYDGSDPVPGEKKLKRGDEGYDAAVKKDFADYIKNDNAMYVWYDCIHICALVAFVGLLSATAINRRTFGPNDTEFIMDKPVTRALGGVAKPVTAVSDMKMPRAFLWTFALPSTVAGIILGLVGGYNVLSATITHAFVTVPCAFGCFTLFAFFASLFNGRVRVAAYAVLALIGVAAIIFPFALFIMSILGVCDCILNLRFWTMFIKED